MSARDEQRPWQTREGERLEWSDMSAGHLRNAAQFLRGVARERPGLLPGISAYVGDECASPREAIRLAKRMRSLANRKLSLAGKPCRQWGKRA